MNWEALRCALLRGTPAGRDPAPLTGGLEPAAADVPGEIELLGEALRAELRRRPRGVLRLAHVDAGSCNGCESELRALLGPFHDVQRFGVGFVPSPRQADALLVTGPVTIALEAALRAAEQAMPQPGLLVAVGDCACDGGFCAGSPAVRRGGGAVRPADVLVPGCPPSPGQILRALLAAMGRERVLEGATASPPGARR
ncbi:MAG TPA: hypothetical protein VMH61_06290 [Candidatus Acidoferrales bacterium]|nr:hypothetical protein [Candidatus Acidoferrales bacterium]